MEEEVIKSLAFVNDVVYSDSEIKITIELPRSKKHIILVILKNSNLYNIYKNKIKRDNIIGFKAEINNYKEYIVSNLYILDENIEWSNVHYVNEFNKRELSLVYHTNKHPIKEQYKCPWKEKPMNIDYDNFNTIKDSYEKASKSIVINNSRKKSQWKYNDEHGSLDIDTIIDKDYTLRVSIKHSKNSDPVIATCHIRPDKYREEICKKNNEDVDNKAINYYFIDNYKKGKDRSLEELYNCAFYYLRKLKYIKTRYFKDVPSAFYTSDQYDFYETVDNIEKLVLFRRLLNSNEYDFKKGIQQYNKLKKRYIEFIGTDTIQYIFYNLERFCGIETN